MGEEKPETKDSFREDVKDCISDDLGINVNVTRTIGNAPDTRMNQLTLFLTRTLATGLHIHWVDCPEDQGESTNRSEERSGVGILGGGNGTAIHGQLVDDHEISNTSNGIISPLGSLIHRESGEKAS